MTYLNTFDPCVLMLVVDVTELDPREALHDMSNSSKVGIGIVLVTREALNNFGSFFLIDDDIKVCYPLESLLKILGNPFFTGDMLKILFHWESLR